MGKNFSLFFFVHISTNLNTERYAPIALKPMLCEVANTKFKKTKNSLVILHNVLPLAVSGGFGTRNCQTKLK